MAQMSPQTETGSQEVSLPDSDLAACDATPSRQLSNQNNAYKLEAVAEARFGSDELLK